MANIIHLHATYAIKKRVKNLIWRFSIHHENYWNWGIQGECPCVQVRRHSLEKNELTPFSGNVFVPGFPERIGKVSSAIRSVSRCIEYTRFVISDYPDLGLTLSSSRLLPECHWLCRNYTICQRSSIPRTVSIVIQIEQVR